MTMPQGVFMAVLFGALMSSVFRQGVVGWASFAFACGLLLGARLVVWDWTQSEEGKR
jgi:hypothetical protein